MPPLLLRAFCCLLGPRRNTRKTSLGRLSNQSIIFKQLFDDMGSFSLPHYTTFSKAMKKD